MKLNPVQFLPTAKTSANEWQAWHEALKSRYGRKTANQLWILAWKQFGDDSKDTSDLRHYLEKNGLKLEKSTLDSLVDTGGDAFDWAGDLMSIGKWTGIAVIGIVLGGSAMIIYNLAKNPAQNIGVATRAFVTKGA